jgi:hypothetical protein
MHKRELVAEMVKEAKSALGGLITLMMGMNANKML